MRCFLEFGSQKVDVGRCTIPDLASIDPSMITQRLVTHGIAEHLSGVAVFEDKGRPCWEAYPDGGDLSWRGDLTRAALRRVWRALCCTLAEAGRPIVGARLLDKSQGGSGMIKIEVWYDGAPEPVRPLVLRAVEGFLPATVTQFAAVSHGAKIARTGALRRAGSGAAEARTVSRARTEHRDPRSARGRRKPDRARASAGAKRRL